MQLKCAAAITSGPDPLVEHLALRLLALAGDQSVRTVEALAAVLTNQEDDGVSPVEGAPTICPPGGEAFARQGTGRTELSAKLSLCRPRRPSGGSPKPSRPDRWSERLPSHRGKPRLVQEVAAGRQLRLVPVLQALASDWLWSRLRPHA